MTIRQTVVLGSITGFLISAAVLTLMWFGVRGVLGVGGTDLMYVFWPSSVILVVSWRTTAYGISITVCSVLTNCAMYAGIALLLRAGIRGLTRVLRSSSGASTSA